MLRRLTYAWLIAMAAAMEPTAARFTQPSGSLDACHVTRYIKPVIKSFAEGDAYDVEVCDYQ